MSLYPKRVTEINEWAISNGTTSTEARTRFMQFAILSCLSRHDYVSERMALKGGNALRFIFGSSRSTADLDFSSLNGELDDETIIRTHINAALKINFARMQYKAVCQNIQKQPKKGTSSPTYQIKIGYSLYGDRGFENFDQSVRSSSEVIKVEISINEMVCETENLMIMESVGTEIKTCILEDIVAEKLRSIIQQKIRNRTRPQDVYDISSLLDRDIPIDLEKVSDFLVKKSFHKSIQITKLMFDDEAKNRAEVGYDSLQVLDRIEFNEAWRKVLDLVNRLEIPE